MPAPTAPQLVDGRLPVTIRTTVPATSNGVHVLARVDAPTVGLPVSYLVLDPASGQIALMAPCGCSVQHSLTSLILSLAESVAGQHPQADEAATTPAAPAASTPPGACLH